MNTALCSSGGELIFGRLSTSVPMYSLFTRLPSGERYRSIGCRTTGLRSSLIPRAVRLSEKDAAGLKRTQTWFHSLKPLFKMTLILSCTSCNDSYLESLIWNMSCRSWWVCEQNALNRAAQATANLLAQINYSHVIKLLSMASYSLVQRATTFLYWSLRLAH